MASTTFRFLHTTPSPLRDRWCAASRAPFASMTPVLVPSACADLPNRDALESAPPSTGFTQPMHSEDQRARVEGPSEGRVPWRMHSRACVRCLRLSGVGRRRSPPRLPSDIRCHRRARSPRRKPLQTITSRPRPSFRRRPAKEAAIRKTGMPLAATTREGNERGEIAPSGLRAGSLAHAAHTFSPGWGECFEGHCKCHGAVTRDP